jgi:hypothetical protein
MGLTHLALTVGPESEVDRLTSQLRADGHPELEGRRRTGDGYYESAVLDPEGNRVELTAEKRGPKVVIGCKRANLLLASRSRSSSRSCC